MSRLYEVMFIVRPDVAEEDVDKLIAGFTTTVTNGGGVVKNVEKMGRRKLAYHRAQVQRRQLHFDDHRGRMARWCSSSSAVCASPSRSSSSSPCAWTRKRSAWPR